MTQKIFITGLPGSGKSSLVKEIISELNIKVGGILTPEIRKKGKRIGFEIIDVLTGKKGILADLTKGKPRIGKYKVNIKDLENMGVKAIENAIESPEIKLIIIDELGRMELLSKKFELMIERASNSEKNLLVVLHRKFVKKYKNKGKLFFLTKENRDQIKENILKILK